MTKKLVSKKLFQILWVLMLTVSFKGFSGEQRASGPQDTWKVLESQKVSEIERLTPYYPHDLEKVICKPQLDQTSKELIEMALNKSQNLPRSKTNGKVQIRGEAYMHAHIWPYKQITGILDCLKEIGFGYIQVSPIHHFKGGAWFDVYQPRSYNIGNPLGTLEDLKELTHEAHKRGIKIIADVVFNQMYNVGFTWHNSENRVKHILGWNPDTLQPIFSAESEANVNLRLRNKLNEAFSLWPYFNSDHFHQIGPYNDPVESWLNGDLPDIKTNGSAVVDDAVFKFVKYLLEEVGIDGFRVDAVKHIHAELFKSVYKRLWNSDIAKEKVDNLIWYGEYISSDKETITSSPYYEIDKLKFYDFPLAQNLYGAFKPDGDLSTINNDVINNRSIEGTRSITFTINHDSMNEQFGDWLAFGGKSIKSFKSDMSQYIKEGNVYKIKEELRPAGVAWSRLTDNSKILDIIEKRISAQGVISGAEVNWILEILDYNVDSFEALGELKSKMDPHTKTVDLKKLPGELVVKITRFLKEALTDFSFQVDHFEQFRNLGNGFQKELLRRIVMEKVFAVARYRALASGFIMSLGHGNPLILTTYPLDGRVREFTSTGDELEISEGLQPLQYKIAKQFDVNQFETQAGILPLNLIRAAQIAISNNYNSAQGSGDELTREILQFGPDKLAVTWGLKRAQTNERFVTAVAIINKSDTRWMAQDVDFHMSPTSCEFASYIRLGYKNEPWKKDTLKEGESSINMKHNYQSRHGRINDLVVPQKSMVFLIHSETFNYQNYKFQENPTDCSQQKGQ